MSVMTRMLLIVGGGPAGMMAGLLFARAGVPVHGARKARRLLPRFPRRHGPPLDDGDPRPARAARALPRAAARRARHARSIRVAGRDYTIGDLSHLDTPAPFIAMMPQWEFLDFLRDEAEAYPGFKLEMEAPVDGFIEEDGRIVGVASRRRPRDCARQADHRRRRPLVAGPRSACCRSKTSARRWTCSGSACPRPTTAAMRCAASSSRAAGRADRPRRLLAVRLPHPQGHGRGSVKARGIDWLPRARSQQAAPDLDLSGDVLTIDRRPAPARPSRSTG